MRTCNLLVLLAFIAMGSVHAQSFASSGSLCTTEEPLPPFAAGLTYDVASIRPHAVDDGSMRIADPPKAARFDITGVPMKGLISAAYGVASFEITGPDWTDSQRFDLQARGDDATDAILAKLTDCQARIAKTRMLRALLADRVKLLAHRVTKEGQGYDLVTAKSGPKLHESPPQPPDDSSPPHGRGGGMSSRSTRLGIKMDAHRYTTQNIAGWLTVEMRCPVTDKTGLAGTYDFAADYSLKDQADQSDSSGEPPYPPLAVALQEQLGLRLEPTKVPIETLIIDHIEQPSEN